MSFEFKGYLILIGVQEENTNKKPLFRICCACKEAKDYLSAVYILTDITKYIFSLHQQSLYNLEGFIRNVTLKITYNMKMKWYILTLILPEKSNLCTDKNR